MALEQRIKRIWEHTISRHGTIPAAVVRHNCAAMRRIIGEECRKAIAEGRMTEEQFSALARKFDAVWHPW
jgi:hypothetical protein